MWRVKTRKMINRVKKLLENREVGIMSSSQIKHYSVLVPLIIKDNKISILFEKRSKNITQSSDICFPGGKVELNESYEFAAMRETHEELLVKIEQIEILGELDMYVAHDKLIVHPFIGVIHDYQKTFFEDEVEEIYLIALDELLMHEPEMYAGKFTLQLGDDFPYSKIEGGRSYPWREPSHQILFYNTIEITIWGMTAQILRAALDIIKVSD